MFKTIPTIISLILITLFFSSCSTKYRAQGDKSKNENFKEIVERRTTASDCIITTIDNQTIVGKTINFEVDTLNYIDENFLSSTIPLSNLSSIAIKSDRSGVGVGAAVGGVTGSMIGGLTDGSLGVLLFTPIGAVIGLTIGAGVDPYDIYIFNEIDVKKSKNNKLKKLYYEKNKRYKNSLE